MLDLIAKLFGIIGLVTYIMAFQCKSPRKLIFISLCSDFSYAIQMFLLGGYTGCAILVIASVYGLIQCCYGKKR